MAAVAIITARSTSKHLWRRRELDKDHTKEHAKLDGEKPTRPQQYTGNHRQLSEAGAGRGPQRGTQ